MQVHPAHHPGVGNDDHVRQGAAVLERFDDGDCAEMNPLKVALFGPATPRSVARLAIRLPTGQVYCESCARTLHA